MPTSISPRTSAELFAFENRKKIVKQCNFMEGKTSNFHGKHSLAGVNQHCFCKKDFLSCFFSLKKVLIRNVGLKNKKSHASVHVLVLNLLYSCCLFKGFHLNGKNGKLNTKFHLKAKLLMLVKRSKIVLMNIAITPPVLLMAAPFTMCLDKCTIYDV